ncbi:DUF1127 domain-containing protein [Billgrantia saliphila]|uniref:DUF1127 domain-containing protein n=1 Tax=Billgrantia saliphila TaxID=1848458 RepID=UPI000CE502A7|nr:DUF1127 domain-containing protein [Halomonas saliphila]
MFFLAWMRLRGRFQHLRQRSHSRRRLLELDERLLNDIGLDRSTARREASKPFWR